MFVCSSFIPAILFRVLIFAIGLSACVLNSQILAQEQDEPNFNPVTTKEVKQVVIDVFAAVHDGFSPDEVLLDDLLQQKFVDGCQARLPDASVETLNWALLNLRKQGELSAIKTTRSNRVRLDDVRHVAEIAARSLQDKHGILIDRVMSNPAYREEFDAAAKQIDSEIDLYRVRKAAFQLRKARQLKPELITRIADWGRVVTTRTTAEVKSNLNIIPVEPGIYIFRDATGYLYIGEAEDLRRRLTEHLDDSDRKSLAAYLATHGHDDITIEIHTFDAGSRIKELAVRRAYESELIRSRNPRFNIRP